MVRHCALKYRAAHLQLQHLLCDVPDLPLLARQLTLPLGQFPAELLQLRVPRRHGGPRIVQLHLQALVRRGQIVLGGSTRLEVRLQALGAVRLRLQLRGNTNTGGMQGRCTRTRRTAISTA